MRKQKNNSLKKMTQLSKDEMKRVNGGADLKKFAEDLVNLSVKP